MRMIYRDGITRVEFQFYKIDLNKSRITVQYNILNNSSEAEEMKTYRSEKLDALKRTAGPGS